MYTTIVVVAIDFGLWMAIAMKDPMKVNAFWWIIHHLELPNKKFKSQFYFRFIHPELKKVVHFHRILL